MRKKSKKRIPQDVRPWNKVFLEDENRLEVLGNELHVRWTSGNRRNKKTTVLNKQASIEYSKTLLRSFSTDISSRSVWAGGSNKHNTKFKKDYLNRIQVLYPKTLLNLKHKYHQLSAIPRLKNTCYFLGKGSTFNRELLVSRHTLRKLTRFGLISGLRQGNG